MKYKGILMDLDDTLYEYGPCHQPGLEKALAYIAQILAKDIGAVRLAYQRARQSIHLDLHGQAASHHRLLYFQRTLEMLGGLKLEAALQAYEAYWSEFLGKMRLRPDVPAFFTAFRDIPICIITDLTAHIQFRKLVQLQIEPQIAQLVTSEEAGVEKPNPAIFHLALHKLGLKPSEVCMVGDSLQKDVNGALRLGIQAYWLTSDPQEAPDGVVKFTGFQQLREAVT